jgi:hypothetical protein
MAGFHGFDCPRDRAPHRPLLLGFAITCGFGVCAGRIDATEPPNPAGPVPLLASTPEAGTSASVAPKVRADAGDDQIGLVGRQITLNAGRSEPRGKVGFRWIQVGGAAVENPSQEGYIYSFTPKSAGVYRFALVVAAGSEISQPDLVEVMVGVLDAPAAGAAAPAGTTPGASAAPAQGVSVEDFFRSSLAAIPGGPQATGDLARTFEELAGRMELYQNYYEIYTELSRRLDTFVPQDPGLRNLWSQRVFSPLTANLIEQMRVVGLDLSRTDAAGLPLTEPQKYRLAEFYRVLAKGCKGPVESK